MFHKILSSLLKSVTTSRKQLKRVLNLPLITSKNLHSLVILAKLLAICLVNLISIKALWKVFSTWSYFQHICLITKIIIAFLNHMVLQTMLRLMVILLTLNKLRSMTNLQLFSVYIILVTIIILVIITIITI